MHTLDNLQFFSLQIPGQADLCSRLSEITSRSDEQLLINVCKQVVDWANSPEREKDIPALQSAFEAQRQAFVEAFLVKHPELNVLDAENEVEALLSAAALPPFGFADLLRKAIRQSQSRHAYMVELRQLASACIVWLDADKSLSAPVALDFNKVKLSELTKQLFLKTCELSLSTLPAKAIEALDDYEFDEQEQQFIDDAIDGHFIYGIDEDGTPYAVGARGTGSLFSMPVVEKHVDEKITSGSFYKIAHPEKCA